MPWPWIVGLLLLGLFWTAFWMYYEMGRTVKPKVEPVKEVITLPSEMKRLCSLIEAKKNGFIRSLMSREEKLTSKQRKELLKRALADGLKKGSTSGFIPLFVKHRDETFEALKPYLTVRNEALYALEIFAELYVDVELGWRKEAQKEHRQVIYDLLEVGLDKPTSEPELSIRVVALGIVDRARDTSVIPILRKMTSGEPNKLRKTRLTELMDKLQAIKQSTHEQ